MTEQTILLIVLVSFLAGSTAGWLAGDAHGNRRGNAEGWLEAYFDRVKQDRERRDAGGRFKAATKHVKQQSP